MKLLALLGLVAIWTNALRVAEQKHGGNSPSYYLHQGGGKSGTSCSSDD